MKENEFTRMISNPFYCLRKVDDIFIGSHAPLVSEEAWIKASVQLMGEIGKEEYLRQLLNNLKGEYLVDPGVVPDGYKIKIK